MGGLSFPKFDSPGICLIRPQHPDIYHCLLISLSLLHDDSSDINIYVIVSSIFRPYFSRSESHAFSCDSFSGIMMKFEQRGIIRLHHRLHNKLADLRTSYHPPSQF